MKKCVIILLCQAFFCLGMPPFLPFPSFPLIEEPDFDLRTNIMPAIDRSELDKTTKTEKLKDGTEVTTTNIKGPNFMVHEESAFKSSKGKGKLADKDFSSAISPLLLKGFPIPFGFGNLFASGPKKCKPKCKADDYCNEDLGKCVPKLKTGFDCQLDKECQSGLLCVWGICNAAMAGDAGTLCKASTQCTESRICWSNSDDNQKRCIPKLSEGARCGKGDFFNFGSIKEDKNGINPCADGLKCSSVGSSANKICVKTSFKGLKFNELKVEKVDDVSSGDDASADDEEEEEKDDDAEDEHIPVKTSDGKKIPGSNKKFKNKKSTKKTSKSDKSENKKKKENHLKFVHS